MQDRSITPLPAAGQRKIWVAGMPVPVSATATRRAHMRELLTSRKYIWRYATFCGVLFLAAAITRKPVLAGIALLVGIVAATALLVREATGHAHRDFFAGYALKNELAYSDRMSLAMTTPLLGAGDRRYCEHYMEGPLRGSDHVVGMAHFNYETRDERRDRRNRKISVYTPHWFTICVVDIPRAAETLPGIYLTRRGGIFGRGGWLEDAALMGYELEDKELARRNRLLLNTEVGREKTRSVFQPSFQHWLADIDLPVGFEYARGTLVVYTAGRLKTTHELDAMLLVTQRVAAQISREGEHLRAVSPSVPPPSADAGTGRWLSDFPAPPPATKPQIAAVPDPPLRSRVGSASVPPPGA